MYVLETLLSLPSTNQTKILTTLENFCLQAPNDGDHISEKLGFQEPNHQNLVQITCDLLKLITKNEFVDKIQNSNYSSSQYDELHRFVTALKSVSN